MKELNSGENKSGALNILVAFLILFSCKCPAQSTPSRTLLALSKSDHTLAIVDPVTLKVIARVPVGSDPHEVISSADGKTPMFQFMEVEVFTN